MTDQKWEAHLTEAPPFFAFLNLPIEKKTKQQKKKNAKETEERNTYFTNKRKKNVSITATLFPLRGIGETKKKKKEIPRRK